MNEETQAAKMAIGAAQPAARAAAGARAAPRVAEEQLAYAQVLDTGMKLGFLQIGRAHV